MTRWQVLLDRVTQRSRGFGFVTFENASTIDTFIEKKDHTIDGKVVEVYYCLQGFGVPVLNEVFSSQLRKAIPKGSPQDSRSTQIFVGAIGAATPQDLKTYFSQFGEITDAQVCTARASRFLVHFPTCMISAGDVRERNWKVSRIRVCHLQVRFDPL